MTKTGKGFLAKKYADHVHGQDGVYSRKTRGERIEQEGIPIEKNNKPALWSKFKSQNVSLMFTPARMQMGGAKNIKRGGIGKQQKTNDIHASREVQRRN